MLPILLAPDILGCFILTEQCNKTEDMACLLLLLVHWTKLFPSFCFQALLFKLGLQFWMHNSEFEIITPSPSPTYLERWCHMNNNSSLLVPHEVHALICLNYYITSSEVYFVIFLSSWISGYLLNSSFQEPYFTALQRDRDITWKEIK